MADSYTIKTAQQKLSAMVAEAADHDGFQAHLNMSLKERLASRLTEMQTRQYLAQPHLP